MEEFCLRENVACEDERELQVSLHLVIIWRQTLFCVEGGLSHLLLFCVFGRSRQNVRYKKNKEQAKKDGKPDPPPPKEKDNFRNRYTLKEEIIDLASQLLQRGMLPEERKTEEYELGELLKTILKDNFQRESTLFCSFFFYSLC